MALSDFQREVKSRFMSEPPRIWRRWHEALLEIAPDFLEAYRQAFIAIPWNSGLLSEKDKELIWLAIDVATTHLFRGGAKIHIERAIGEGASAQEVLDIFAIVSQLGLQSYQLGIPMLKEALEKRDGPAVPLDDAYRAERRERFVARIGHWDDWWEDLLEVSPETFEATLAYVAFPWTSGALPPKMKAFIWLAVNASTTHLFLPAIKLGIDLALKHGASKEEIVEVLQLTAVLGIHTFSMSMPILMDALGREIAIPEDIIG